PEGGGGSPPPRPRPPTTAGRTRRAAGPTGAMSAPGPKAPACRVLEPQPSWATGPPFAGHVYVDRTGAAAGTGSHSGPAWGRSPEGGTPGARRPGPDAQGRTRLPAGHIG